MDCINDAYGREKSKDYKDITMCVTTIQLISQFNYNGMVSEDYKNNVK